MAHYFKKIDMYGVSFSLTTFGQENFKTNFGAFLTIVTFFIIVIFTYFFGTDFWHNQNPNIITTDTINLTSKKVKITNEKYSFMLGLTDSLSNSLDQDKMPLKFFGTYVHNKKNSDGKFETLCTTYGNEILSKCSETNARLSPDLKNEKLENWICWDMEKIKAICREQIKDKDPEYEPFIGGNFDEDEYAFLGAHVVNFIRDFKQNKIIYSSTVEDIQKLGTIFINFRYPNVSFDGRVEGNPLRTYYESQLIILDTRTWRRDDRFMQLVTSIDDDGWIFSNKIENESLIPDKTNSDYMSSSLFPKNSLYFYSVFVFGSKKEKEYYRNFMKLQTLVAIVGGMLKSVTNIFFFFLAIQAVKERDQILVEQFFMKKQKKGKQENSEIVLKTEQVKVNSFIKKKINVEDQPEISIWSYIFCCCRESRERIEKERIQEKLKAFLYERMDITYMFKIYEQFSFMKQILLTEEQRELLEKNMFQEIREA